MRTAAVIGTCCITARIGTRSTLRNELRSLVAGGATSPPHWLLLRTPTAAASRRAFVSLANVVPRASPSAPREHRDPPPPLPPPQLLHLQDENCSIECIDLPAPSTATDDDKDGALHRATLVVMHGAPGTYRDYRHIIPLLQQQQTRVSMRVIGVNLPGFGGSVVDSARYVDAVSALPAAATTLRALHELCACDENVFLMGHSFGAHAAINIAALNQADHSREPLGVKGMALLAPAGCRPHRVLRPKLNAAVVDILRSANPVVAHALAALAKVVYTKLLGFSSDFPASHYVAGIVRAGTTDFATVTEHVRSTRRTTPALLAWSASDEFMEDAVPAELARLCHPGGPRIAFIGGGHNIQKTRADFLADAVVQWVCDVLDANNASSSSSSGGDEGDASTSLQSRHTNVQVHP